MLQFGHVGSEMGSWRREIQPIQVIYIKCNMKSASIAWLKEKRLQKLKLSCGNSHFGEQRQVEFGAPCTCLTYLDRLYYQVLPWDSRSAQRKPDASKRYTAKMYVKGDSRHLPLPKMCYMHTNHTIPHHNQLKRESVRRQRCQQSLSPQGFPPASRPPAQPRQVHPVLRWVACTHPQGKMHPSTASLSCL